MIKKYTINNIYDLIELIEKRPGMYIGDSTISSFRTFLDGYQFSSLIHNIESEQVFPPFWYFHEWAMHEYNWGESTAGWKNIILEENENDEELALTKCFDLLREFRNLKPISIQKSSLTKVNTDFHHSQECRVKVDRNPPKQELEPPYKVADEIYILEFSHDFGFSVFIRYNDKRKWNHWRERFKTKEESIKKCELLFGKSLTWKEMTGDLVQKANAILKNC